MERIFILETELVWTAVYFQQGACRTLPNKVYSYFHIGVIVTTCFLQQIRKRSIPLPVPIVSPQAHDCFFQIENLEVLSKVFVTHRLK